jgi:hypothetical protein
VRATLLLGESFLYFHTIFHIRCGEQLDKRVQLIQLRAAVGGRATKPVWEVVCVVILINRGIVLVHLVLVLVLIIDREPIG